MHPEVQGTLTLSREAYAQCKQVTVVIKHALFYLLFLTPFQILDLLHFKDKLTARQFQRVATRAVHFMLETKPSVGQQNLLAPLLGPLGRCTAASS